MILTNVLTNSRERTRFFRFAIVGTFGAFVDFGTFNLLAGILKVNHILASIISFIAALISNFIWNRYWTYPDSRSKSISKQLTQFAIVNLGGLIIRTPIFALLSLPLEKLFEKFPFVPLGAFTAEALGNNTALAIAVIVVLFWNFFANRYWTYSDIE